MALYRMSTATRLDTTNVIPSAMLNCLPFSLEPIEKWSKDSDLYSFIYHLLDSEAIIEDENGNIHKTNYRNLAPSYFAEGKEKAEALVRTMSESFSRFPNASEKEIVKPEFEKSSEFGKSAKYIIAWERIIANTLEESLFFSISHALESEHDIQCSLYLVSNYYYKQAIQVMRSFLESMVLPIYFCEYPKEFERWKNNKYHIPSMRRKGDGILAKLSTNKILPHALIEEVHLLYGELNSYIHGSENSFISRGIFQGDNFNYGYNESDFSDWCTYICRTINLGILLLSVNLNQWRNDLNSSTIRICNICHGSNLIVELEFFAGHKTYKYTCTDCKNSQSFC